MTFEDPAGALLAESAALPAILATQEPAAWVILGRCGTWVCMFVAESQPEAERVLAMLRDRS